MTTYRFVQVVEVDADSLESARVLLADGEGFVLASEDVLNRDNGAPARCIDAYVSVLAQDSPELFDVLDAAADVVSWADVVARVYAACGPTV